MEQALVPAEQSPRTSVEAVTVLKRSGRIANVELDCDGCPIVFGMYINQFEQDTLYYQSICGSELASMAPSTMTPPPKRSKDKQLMDTPLQPNNTLRKNKIIEARD